MHGQTVKRSRMEARRRANAHSYNLTGPVRRPRVERSDQARDRRRYRELTDLRLSHWFPFCHTRSQHTTTVQHHTVHNTVLARSYPQLYAASGQLAIFTHAETQQNLSGPSFIHSKAPGKVWSAWAAIIHLTVNSSNHLNPDFLLLFRYCT
jgi:hypothetical protein